MSDFGVTIEGLQRAQHAMERVYAAVRPSGALGKAVHQVTAMVHRFAVYYTPWDSGGLRASHRMRFVTRRMMGIVDLDPALRNPRQGGARPHVYGWHLHRQGRRPGRRGGIRAFYAHTVAHRGQAALRHGANVVRRGLP